MGKIRIKVLEEINLWCSYLYDNIEWHDRCGKNIPYKVSYVNKPKSELNEALEKISFYEAIPLEKLKQDVKGIGR